MHASISYSIPSSQPTTAPDIDKITRTATKNGKSRSFQRRNQSACHAPCVASNANKERARGCVLVPRWKSGTTTGLNSTWHALAWMGGGGGAQRPRMAAGSVNQTLGEGSLPTPRHRAEGRTRLQIRPERPFWWALLSGRLSEMTALMARLQRAVGPLIDRAPLGPVGSVALLDAGAA